MRQSHLLHFSAALSHQAHPSLHSDRSGMKVPGSCYQYSAVARAEVEHHLFWHYRGQGQHPWYDVFWSRDVWLCVIHSNQVVSSLIKHQGWQGSRREPVVKTLDQIEHVEPREVRIPSSVGSS